MKSENLDTSYVDKPFSNAKITPTSIMRFMEDIDIV